MPYLIFVTFACGVFPLFGLHGSQHVVENEGTCETEKDVKKIFRFLNLCKVFVNMFKSGSGSRLCRLSERLGTTPDRVKKSRL